MSAASETPGSELRAALREADSLETFQSLPRPAQDNLSRWIDKARDDESRWRRIEALVLAMRISPLQSQVPPATTDGAKAAG